MDGSLFLSLVFFFFLGGEGKVVSTVDEWIS